MALPLPEGVHITVTRRKLEADYAMPSMEMATDHYNIGYTISGDRRTIIPSGTFDYHSGEVAMLSPYVYHRTISTSGKPYDSVLIKFSPEFAASFIENVGQQVFDELYEKRVFHFSEETSEKIKEMFLDMVEEYGKQRPYKEFILQGMLNRLLTKVWEEGYSRQEEPGRTLLTPPVMDAVLYIEQFYSSNPSLERTAREVNLSPSYFSRLFHEQLGKTYSEYLNNVKLRHAAVLLMSTNRTIMEIAEETGYCHGNYMINQFKEKMGITPGELRKKAIQKKI